MSVFSKLVEDSVQAIVDAQWQTRDGQVVPETEDIVLKNGAVNLDATYLYADLANSSRAAQALKRTVTARIIRTYLDAASRLIRHFGGEIRSFDGDRVMGIFVGDAKNTSAVKAGMGINWAVKEVLRPMLKSKWNDLSTWFTLNHGVGVATGTALLVRAGVRNSNDLVSVGEAPNIAAKLSDLRGTPDVYITADVYGNMNEVARITKGKNMWANVAAQEIG